VYKQEKRWRFGLRQALTAWRRVKARHHAAVRIAWVNARRSR
jgi:hypothetical protein